jgi:hypothetical protein
VKLKYCLFSPFANVCAADLNHNFFHQDIVLSPDFDGFAID